ncbi:DUF2851 family protein [Membranihabitans marinus]|uniref:DUF2851 family protein n=1 Tax=Membranihabitans marinus TaxID=1227546 RepID=UPI001F1EAEC9|nr:DUF2851 family protein [Membranihabitans marinus]
MKEYSPSIKEDFIQYIWRTQKFDKDNLCTAAGEPLEILKTGLVNKEQGPDFFDARIRISGQLWAGKVEIHTNSSDWAKHGHSDNPDYFNVILHVVYEDDEPVKDQYGDPIPTLVLKDRIDLKILETYTYLNSYEYESIPCEKLISKVSKLNITAWKERMAVSRLEQKFESIEEVFVFSNKNYQETLFKLLCRAFGFSKNSTAFEWMANTIQFKILSKHLQDREQLEALLFGQAGMLDGEFEDEYPNTLKKEYTVLAEKYNLTSIDPAVWNFGRIRPQNFPTIRIAQLADFLYKYGQKFMYTLQWNQLSNGIDCQASEYWNNHYRFDVVTESSKPKNLGKTSLHLILINVLAPFMFFSGHQKRDQQLKNNALAILENTTAEKNAIIKKWEKLNIKIDHALDSQALLYLHNEYCMNRKCAQCNIGQAILLKS